mmetsp:Transcript_25762/g.56124  ORF Transcript_25762/g.56124 Transcript_25762/m.56124 type:complete len:537 (+) Transcript_25762:75-1685(+)
MSDLTAVITCPDDGPSLCGWENCAPETFAEMLTTLNFSEDQAKFICTNFVTPTQVSDAVFGVTEGLNVVYLVLCGALVFIMHGGFAMLCAGAIRSKNTMNILLQTILDAAVSGIAFYLLGYGFAYGGYPAMPPNNQMPNSFIGNGLFALSKFETDNPNPGHWQDFFFQWAFCATATTIPAGAVAERFNFNAYLGYSFFIAAFVYPVIVHWVWSQYGWLGYARAAPLTHLFRAGFIDFAGSGVVHMVGGLSGFWGCVLVGPRMGRFDGNGKPVDMPGHSATLVVLGTVLLWFGWYGFNPGSMILANTSDYAQVIGRAAVTTTLAGSAGGVMGLVLSFARHKAWDLLAVCNGVLCGFVSITAGCHVLEPWAAIIAGAVGVCFFEAVCIMFLRFKIDDPLCAAPMHAFCGMWGCLIVGVLAKKDYVYQVYSGSHKDCATWVDGVCQGDWVDSIDNYPYGLFYPGGGGRLLASQVIGILVIAGWTSAMMAPFFAIFKAFGCLRISAEEEQAGLDVSKHGGSAYNYDHGLGKPDKAPPMMT